MLPPLLGGDGQGVDPGDELRELSLPLGARGAETLHRLCELVDPRRRVSRLGDPSADRLELPAQLVERPGVVAAAQALLETVEPLLQARHRIGGDGGLLLSQRLHLRRQLAERPAPLLQAGRDDLQTRAQLRHRLLGDARLLLSQRLHLRRQLAERLAPLLQPGRDDLQTRAQLRHRLLGDARLLVAQRLHLRRQLAAPALHLGRDRLHAQAELRNAIGRRGERVEPSREVGHRVTPVAGGVAEGVEPLAHGCELGAELDDGVGRVRTTHVRLDLLDPLAKAVCDDPELGPNRGCGSGSRRRRRGDRRLDLAEPRAQLVEVPRLVRRERLLQLVEPRGDRRLETGVSRVARIRELLDARPELLDPRRQLARDGAVGGGRRSDDLGSGLDPLGRRRRRLVGRAKLLERRPLVGERARELEARELAGGDEDLAEPAAALPLLLEGLFELLLGHEPALHEDLSDRALEDAAGGGGDGRERDRRRHRRRLAVLDSSPALVLGPLLGEGAREVEPLDAELLDQDLAEPLARRALLLEGELELLLGDEALLDEDRADQTGGDRRRVHGPLIGNPSFEL